MVSCRRLAGTLRPSIHNQLTTQLWGAHCLLTDSVMCVCWLRPTFDGPTILLLPLDPILQEDHLFTPSNRRTPFSSRLVTSRKHPPHHWVLKIIMSESFYNMTSKALLHGLTVWKLLQQEEKETVTVLKRTRSTFYHATQNIKLRDNNPRFSYPYVWPWSGYNSVTTCT